VLAGVSLTVHAGEVVSLMGRNGMGKSTLVKTILGLIRPDAGRVVFRGQDITAWPSHRIARLGLGYVPEGRQIFPTLTVRENLLATAANFANTENPWTLDSVLSLFPRLGERLNNFGRNLSGGEQQMLAIGRALMTNPLMLILDEATEGLAPLVREEIWACLENDLKPRGQSILVIDRHPHVMARLADRHYIMEKGRIAWTGDSTRLMADVSMQHQLLGV
jgi:branched-chain amino acid transport system ATP-binding protein